MYHLDQSINKNINTNKKPETNPILSENQYWLKLLNSHEKNKESIEKYLENIIKPWCIEHQKIDRKKLEVNWKLIYRNLDSYKSIIADHMSKKNISAQEFTSIYEEQFATRIKQRSIDQWESGDEYIIWSTENNLVPWVAYKNYNRILSSSNEMNELLQDLCTRFGFDADPEQGEPTLAPIFVAMMLGIGLRWSIDKTWNAARVGINTFISYRGSNEESDSALIVTMWDSSINEAKLSWKAFPHLNFTPST